MYYLMQSNKIVINYKFVTHPKVENVQDLDKFIMHSQQIKLTSVNILRSKYDEMHDIINIQRQILSHHL